jgi:hypothetical protein
MPLIHSKTPKAFKENIRKEVHAGKPVKQAVAIAYHEQDEAKKHKYGMGGCVGAGCPGPHDESYDGGGEVKMMKKPKIQGFDDGGEAEDPNTATYRLMHPLDTIQKSFSDEPHAQSKPTGSNAGSDTGAKRLGASATAAGYKDGGEVEEGPEDMDQEYDSEIGDILGKELMEAFEAKDHKKMMESIEALVLQCLDKSEGE